MPSVLQTALALGSIATVTAYPSSILGKRSVISALPGAADNDENRFQPLLDFDKDGCYNTAAVAPDGATNPGHDATGTPQGDCRDPHQLENSNVYSRKRCNNGICAIMYEYYFEKDQAALGTFAGGHRHDWENIIVFARGDQVIRVAPSCHDGYGQAKNEGFPADGTRPQLVYHKDGVATHCFRFANDDDIAGPENFSGQFYTSPLVGWGSWPSSAIRDKLIQAWPPGGINPKLYDDDNTFTNYLAKAAGDGVPGFDPALDA